MRSGEVSIIDASVIEANRCRPNKDKKGENTPDSEANYNIKTVSDDKLKTTYEFKDHTNIDEDDFIKTYEYTADNVHDSNIVEVLLTDTEEEIYADSTYKNRKHDELLKDKRVRNQVLERASKNTPLTSEQRVNNRINSGVRSIVERVLGVLKLYYGMSKARYLGMS